MTRNPIFVNSDSSALEALQKMIQDWRRQRSRGVPLLLHENMRDRMFKPSLSTIIGENMKVAVVSPSDPVYVAAKRMREFQVNSVIIIMGNKIQGIWYCIQDTNLLKSIGPWRLAAGGAREKEEAQALQGSILAVSATSSPTPLHH
ncbi:hypothetical protein ACFX2I_039113 [Malus domestica]